MGVVWYIVLLFAVTAFAEQTSRATSKQTTKVREEEMPEVTRPKQMTQETAENHAANTNNQNSNYQISDVSETVSGEILVLSNPGEVKNLDDLLEEADKQDDMDWKTLTEDEQTSLRGLLKNVATSAISESPKQPKSNLIAALKILMKNMVRLESRLTNQTKQTTSVMKSLVQMKSECQCGRTSSELMSTKKDLAMLQKAFHEVKEKSRRMIENLHTQFTNMAEAQKAESEKTRKMINEIGLKTSPEMLAQQMERVKADIDRRLAGLVQQGKGGRNQCGVLDQQAAMLYGMWQNLYKPAEFGSVKVVQATQSSVGWRGVPSRAVDGNKSPVWRNAGCTHTNTQFKPWLLLKLQGISNITGVELTNRGDCCHRRLSNFTIEVFMDDPTASPNVKGKECYHYAGTVGRAATVLVECKVPVRGLYVRIMILQRARAILTICEAVVKGNIIGVLSGKPTLQSSVTSAQTGSDKANDGDKGTCSQTMADVVDSTPWWQVDMRKTVTVRTVYIRNRNDEQYDWLQNITVTVHMKFPSVCAEVTPYLCATFQGTAGKGQVLTLTCRKPIVGRYLKISRGSNKDGGVLSLCEVSVNDGKLIFV